MKTFGGRITWLRHAAFFIESPKGVRVAIDPWIGNNPKFPKGFEFGKVDVLAATHGHFDHFGDDGIALAKTTGATVVAVFWPARHYSGNWGSKGTRENKGGRQSAARMSLRTGTR